jgi:hypothetical protein
MEERLFLIRIIRKYSSTLNSKQTLDKAYPVSMYLKHYLIVESYHYTKQIYSTTFFIVYEDCSISFS